MQRQARRAGGMGTRGFTLMELLIVGIILAVIAALAIPAYMSTVEKSRQQEAIGVLSAIRQAELRNFTGTGAFTASYATLDFDPNTGAIAGNNPHYTYAAPVVAAAGFTATATRNAFQYNGGCPTAAYTIAINEAGAITRTGC